MPESLYLPRFEAAVRPCSEDEAVAALHQTTRHVRVDSLCDGLLVVGRHVDDLVALLPQDVQHAAVPQEVTWRRKQMMREKLKKEHTPFFLLLSIIGGFQNLRMYSICGNNLKFNNSIVLFASSVEFIVQHGFFCG